MTSPPRSWDCRAELVPWDATHTAWVFAALPQQVSDEIDAAAVVKGGFGSVKVVVGLGAHTWSTSVFPDSGRACYVLPVKKAIRTAEGLELGDVVNLRIDLAN
ncbi:DUF1905 domain-containing protein [Herbiconiux sp. L3-i23]|uniref:DUF1905 domain-containing protein n=1 Tax=Herbiconiux sp. L3-i23 TaxID=2905871 RepID=UPI002054F69B|nr:DUF1905 domain-containing protein [Herbiconiux sp. L3-i23]BDI23810.1 hypothetical protein L3i23_25860 [Herbiconiux sp. L3-i23]